MHRWHRADRIGSAALTGAHRPIDPVALKEIPGNFRQARVELLEGIQHDLAPLLPLIFPVGGGQWGVAVVIQQFVQAEQTALEVIVAGYNIVP